MRTTLIIKATRKGARSMHLPTAFAAAVGEEFNANAPSHSDVAGPKLESRTA